MNRTPVARQNGFTIIQMVITVAIIAVSGCSESRELPARAPNSDFRIQQVFASYVEKVRVDSIRRHPTTGDESSIETFGPGTNTYAVSMDFGSGAVETRTFTLETVSLSTQRGKKYRSIGAAEFQQPGFSRFTAIP